MLASPQSEHHSQAIRVFQSKDADEIIQFVGKRLAPHRMDISTDNSITADLRYMSLASAQIVDIQYGSDVKIAPDEPDDYHLVHAALTGCSTAHTNHSVYEMRPNNLHVTSVGRPTRIHMTANCRHLTVRLSRALVDSVLQDTLNITASRPVSFAPEVSADSELPMMWRDLLMHILRQATLAPRTMNTASTQKQYATMMAELLLVHHNHNYSDAIQRYSNDVSPWHVRRARDIIHNSLDDGLSVVTLAQEVGVSVRSLQNGFRDFLGMTPVEYIRSHRLEQLHKALRTAPSESSVTDLMLSCGISSFGRYAQYYKQHYGCSPSDTLRQRRLL